MKKIGLKTEKHQIINVQQKYILKINEILNSFSRDRNKIKLENANLL